MKHKIRSRRRFTCLLSAVAGALTLVMTASCGVRDAHLGGVFAGAVDAAGMTKQQAIALPMHEHFALVAERDRRMAELLAEAQRKISEQPWNFGEVGVIPVRGPNLWSVPGMRLDNSYHLSMWAWIQPEGAHGAQSDLAPMLEHFESNGWQFEVRSASSHRHRVVAETEEGFIMSWRVKPNGIYNLEIYSKSYWGQSRELQRAIAYRIPAEGLRIGPSLPGERPAFPSWADPEQPMLNFGGH